MAAIDFFADLEARGLVHGSSEGVREFLSAGPATGYIGFDPTASGLHVGSLVQILALARLQRAGHNPIALVGGGTGMIGDPSGKTAERKLQTREQVMENVAGIRAELERFLDFSGPGAARMVDNHDWLSGLGLIDFLRDVGKHFTINYMLAKDSVSRRMEQEGGLSVTEFAYSLLQAYDFAELSDRYGALLQVGGSDQWGNITAGMELIRRTRGKQAHGIVQPLITTASGAKFGKTETGTVWLSAERTSPFRFFQFWLNTEDRDVERYLKTFTFLPLDEIAGLVQEHEANAAARGGQRRLAVEVTRLVHGDEGLARAERATGVLFGGTAPQELPAVELLDVFADVPSTEAARDRFGGEGVGIVDLLAEAGVAASKGEARRLISGGGISLNGARVSSPDQRVRTEDAIDGEVLILRKGKKENRVVRLVG
ncbi:tyrosine--tRNA ligase [Longimicrobium terrae]|uniref:Tyrosine--tRNA ligase n=1 Tax=Longimicrobium terrae TaxID=1639882 RepID=A0A841GXA8_9BACT|nr:tyrosine--tRNA ligase [Longimicrobium terrae]MBB4635372.1 tyrosyl-tRNA synthetase [Longimicrobium terrae]MBB6069766.1 tyrosyl-tRNA synthetase [Longimicrobium terrae]NNC31023.1 tyrosine--tRNA ligase [Longimicrobium terrae]